MFKKFYLILVFICLFSTFSLADPWLNGKDEFLVKNLEYLSVKNKFSLDSSAYPIPLALIRNPSEDMFSNISLMNEYVDFAENIIEERSKSIINEFGFSSNSDFNPFRFIDSEYKDKNSLFFSSSYFGERIAAKISLTSYENPYEDKKYDLSDSYIAVVAGNLILGFGKYDRWWGPSHHGSLILSNYSKPSPGIFLKSLEGFSSSLPLISSFGKINFSLFANQLEKNRAIESPYLIGTRISFNPLSGLTIGLTRTIMFGGKGKDNSLRALWDSLTGDESRRENSSDTNIDNELAGFDLKYSFYINNIVWSFYGQYVGEDGSDYWPWRTFYLAGSEFIFFKNGKLNSVSFEYIDTYYSGIGKGHKDKEVATNIIYEHGTYDSGYRYKGSPIGAFIDGDSNYYNFSLHSQIDEITKVEFSLIYGNFNKDDSGDNNSWGMSNEDFFGMVLNFDFKVSEKLKIELNLISLDNSLKYKGKTLDKNILGLNLNYRF